jgi:diguanylate cyclase (GGDEF)-like protein/PAS domain S-box-containing protein
MGAIIGRLQFQLGKEILPESHWRAFLEDVRDYSEKVERELRSLGENREQLLAIIDLIPVAFFVKDHKSRFFLMNRACEEQWGMSFDELRDTDASQVFPPDQMEQFLARDRSIFEGRQPVEFEETFWSAAKQSDRIGYTFKRPMYDANGNPQYLVCVTLDITDRKKAEDALRQERDFTAGLIDGLPGFLALVDRAGCITRWNANLATLTGLTSEELQGFDASMIAVESERDAVRLKIREAYARGFATLEFGVLNKNGDVRSVYWSARIIMHEGRQSLLAAGLDMTETHAAEAQIRESEERFRTVFDAVNDGIIVHAADTAAFLDVNPRICQMFGYTREQFLKLELGDLSTGVSPYTLAETEPLLKRVLAGESVVFEWHCKAQDGHRFWVEVSIRRATYGGRAVLLSTTRDITARKQANEQVTYMARYDALTGLANRGVFIEALNQAIARAHRGAKSFAVLYLDLDHFKDVNDTLGHPVGDLLLRAVADRLRASVRATDTVARFGGDEFAVILSDIQDPADAAVVSGRILGAVSEPVTIQEPIAAAAVADKILKAIGETFLIEGNEIRSSTTIGISVYGANSPDAEAMLAHADVALYRAKSEGRGIYRYFTDAMDTEVRARVSMDRELREAIASDQLFLLYQPQVDIDTGRIVGLEVLVRWHHPTQGVLGPSKFIPAAERNGLIVPLGRWVMREACRQFKLWLDAGIAPPLIAVNLSGIQFKNAAELENDIASILAASGLPARILELELTESVLMEASREHSDLLLRLRKGGHRIAIDDFGSGYSSLNYLRRFPVDRMKIGQSFVADIGVVSGDDAIVRVAIGLARELDIEVVLVGVETTAQLALLKAWGARIVQGYYFARPLPVAEVTALLRVGKITPPPAGRVEIAAA